VEALRSLPIRLLVTVGPGGDPSSLGPQPPHVYVARYVPQTSVLPACAAVVSHAGSGTFLASLAEGLPQVCLPQAADQFLNAAACERTGAGITLLPDSATASAVHDAAAAALGDPGLRTTAERIAAEIATMPAPAAVAEELATRWG
jgi:UDP:flavonoid glycosyltransferase YjiC (YdhE family)